MKKGIILLILTLMVMITIVPVLNRQENQDFLSNSSYEKDPKQPVVSIKGVAEYVTQEPIAILNDSAFGLDVYNFTGYGTYGDPYQITGYNITDDTDTLIYIKDTTKYFIISSCLLNGSNSGFNLIYLENVTHGTIENNTICNTGDGSGIYLDFSSNNTILNNSVHNCIEAIWLDTSSNNTLTGNTIYNCDDGIILASSSYNNTHSTNTIHNCINGIFMWDSHNNTFLNNTIHDCGWLGIILESSCNNNTFSNNTIHDCDVGISLENSCNNMFSSNAFYNIIDEVIFLCPASNNTFSGNTVYNCNGEHGIISLVSSSNNILSENTIQNCPYIGFFLDESSNNNTLSANTIFGSECGIYVRESHNNTFSGNTIYNCYDGILLGSSNNNSLSGNTIYNCSSDGINMAGSSSNTIVGNSIHDCFSGFRIEYDCNNNTLSTNTIYDCSYYGIDMYTSCNHNTLFGNTINDPFGETGIGLESNCNNNTLSGNVIHVGEIGITLYQSNNNSILDNTIYNCSDLGIFMEDSNNNTINYNVICYNTYYGLYIDSGADNNTVNWNNFVGNYVGSGFNQSYDVSSNNNISYNYWDDHTSPDDDPTDGIVDTPYNLEGGSNQDLFPLTKPVLPKMTIDSPLAQDYVTNTITVTLSGFTLHYWYYIEGVDNQNQTWTTSVARALEADGTYTLHAYGNNILGNIVHDSVMFTMDAFIPTITLTSPRNATTHPSGTTIKIVVDDAFLETVLYSWDGTTNHTWNGEYETLLPTGETQHILYVYANDSANHWASAVFIFTTDDTIPTVDLESLTNGTIHPSGTTIDLTVTDSHLETVLYSWDGTTNHTWNGEYETSLPTGETQHILYIYANDSANHWAIAMFVFTTDDTAPTIALESLTNDTIHPSGTTIGLTMTDSHLQTVLYNWDGISNTSLNELYTTLLPSDDGQHILQVYANDSAGNWASVVFTFTTDDTAPTIALESLTNDTAHPSGITINLTVIDTHLETVLYNWDNGTNQTLTTPYNVTLPTEVGRHVLRVYAKDGAGHWTSQTYVFTTRAKSADLGPVIVVGGVAVTLAALTGGGFFLIKKKGLTLQDLLHRGPPEPPED